jgi:iron complex outermembrane receptor protein
MFRFLIAAALVAVCAHPAAAQSAIEGSVADATGAALTGVRLELRLPSGEVRTTTSAADGTFRFEGLPAGRYTVRAERDAFAPRMVVAQVDGPITTLDITLDTLAINESLTVVGAPAAPMLDAPASTSNRLGLTIRETPATVDVVTFAQAQSRGLRSTVEAVATVPAVAVAGLPSSPGITAIRGFTGGAISQLFDGTRVTTSTMITRNYDTWSFDRIEILKGPASVLYGEGALAGAINFVPKRPSFSSPSAEALISYGTMNTPRLAAGATGPLGERAAYRADIAWMQTDGFVDDAGSGTFAANAAVDVRLTPRATLGLSVDHFRDDYTLGYWGTPLVPAAVATKPLDVVSDSRGYVLDEVLRDVNYNVSDAIVDAYSTWVRARLDIALNSTWRLQNDAYLYDALRRYENSEVHTYLPATGLMTRSTVGITHDHRFYGNRFALASDTQILGRRNRFVAGLEANRNDFFTPRRFGSTTSVDLYNPVRGIFPAEDTSAAFPGPGNRVNFDSDVNLVSVFTEDAWSIAPRLTLVGGLRYDRMHLDRVTNDLNASTITAFDQTYEPTSWRAGAVFDLAPQTQAFTQFTSAVAPVATVLLISQANAAFDLTTGVSWEGGLKSTHAGGKLNLTGSVFWIEQDDILTRDPNNFNVTVQGGTQASTGVEVSASWFVTPQLRLDANGAMMDARFVTLLEAGGVDRSGMVPPNVPEQTANLWATYRFDDLPLTVAGGIRHQGRFFTSNANSTEVSGWTTLDALVSWRVKAGDITLRGRNLTDAVVGEWTGASASQVILGAPRSAELAFVTRF